MRAIWIAKCGSANDLGPTVTTDYEDWIADGLRPGLADPRISIKVIDVRQMPVFPTADQIAGVVITGSCAMVTDEPAWLQPLERWLEPIIERDRPVLGICFGHQVLGRLAGGRVDDHPAGREVGTVTIELNQAEAAGDPLMAGLPLCFPAQAMHRQSVLSLPVGAGRVMAGNGHDPMQAVRYGTQVWGVQFHPEFGPEIVRQTIEHHSAAWAVEGLDIPRLLMNLQSTAHSAGLLAKFAACCDRG